MALRDFGRLALPQETLALLAVQAFGLSGYGYSWWLTGDGAMIARGFAGQVLCLPTKSMGCE